MRRTYAGPVGRRVWILVKKAADSELLSAIRAVHAGRTFVDLTQTTGEARLSLRGEVAGRRQPPKSLSRREREVLGLLAQGHSNQQIADTTGLSVKTVETYRTRLSVKLGLKGRAELYRFAAESGILDTDSAAPRQRLASRCRFSRQYRLRLFSCLLLAAPTSPSYSAVPREGG
jgi:DNA-binding CsgD family transcriptional regulator